MLTDTAIVHARRAHSGAKQKKLFDDLGLYLLLTPASGAVWRFKYRFEGREKLLSMGPYPEVTLKMARAKRDIARRQVEDHIDPSVMRRRMKEAAHDRFAEVAEEYIKRQAKKLAPRTIAKARWQIRQFVAPYFGKRPISAITPRDLLAVLRKIELRGKIETAHKTKELCGRIFLYGVATQRCERNIAADLKGALEPRRPKSHAALTDPEDIGALLRSIEGHEGQPATMAAIRLAPHVFLRPGELRAGRWEEVDFKAAQWKIPAARMKMKRDHIVPLSEQALKILKDLHKWTGGGEYIFPAIGPKRRPISTGTLGAALHGLGYTSEQIVPHGFRSMASTLLHDIGFDTRDIELQLAHADKNTIRAIYNRSERIKERTAMMQAWSDHLDKLKQPRSDGSPQSSP